MNEHFFMRIARNFKRICEGQINKRRSAEKVFERIYSAGKWGSAGGSGSGSLSSRIVDPYVESIKHHIARLDLEGRVFVDLGCGDFSVGKRLVHLSSHYIGVDIVSAVIEENRKNFGSECVEFRRMDIVDDELPNGDICFVRQVFQHLSNEQVQKILDRLGKYQYVFITEHYPSKAEGVVKNVDKVQGADIRIYRNSGVYLDAPPFNIDGNALDELLEIEACGLNYSDQGVLRTYVYHSG